MNVGVKVLPRLPASLAPVPDPDWYQAGSQLARPRADILRDWQAVAALAPEWNRLLHQSRSDSIFLTWEWVQAWLAAVGHRHPAFCIAVRDRDGALCGLAPCYVARYRLGGTVPYRVLRLAGDYPTGAEYADWLLRPDLEFASAEAIARALASHGGWEALWMPQVAAWNGAAERLQAACASAGLHCASRATPFAHFRLPDSFAAYEQSLSDNRRKQLRAQRRKILERDGARVTRCLVREDLPRYLEALFELHGRRRQALGEAGSFAARPEEADFYRAFAPLALERGWLWLSALEHAGEIRAVQLGYEYRQAYHQLQEGFDPAFTPGAGNVLRHEVIRQCIAAGVREYDFLGGYTEHKRRWLAEPREGCDLLMGRPQALNALLFAFPVWPTGRYLRPVR